jgi:rod shape-determining protein MreD
MNGPARPRNSTQYVYIFEMFIYTFFLLLLQATFFARLPYPALRADVLLPLMLGIAAEWSPVPSLLWACFWGYAVDVLSGEFWGLHVGSYAVAVCIVNIAADRLDFDNPFYQMSMVGLCALGQSAALGMYMTFEPLGFLASASVWTSLVIRSGLTMVLTPFVIYPVWSLKKSIR